jgi:hypothetical protein
VNATISEVTNGRCRVTVNGNEYWGRHVEGEGGAFTVVLDADWAECGREGLAKVVRSAVDFLGPQEAAPAPVPPLRRAPRAGRNEPCPCGSGAKWKRCCARKGG